MFKENHVDLNAYTVTQQAQCAYLRGRGELARFGIDTHGVFDRNVVVHNAEGYIVEEKIVAPDGNGCYTAEDEKGDLVINGFVSYDHAAHRETLHGDHMQILKAIEYTDYGAIDAIDHYEKTQRRTRTLYRNWRETAHMVFDDQQRVEQLRQPGVMTHFLGADARDWPEPYGLKYGLPFNHGAQIAVVRQQDNHETRGYYNHRGELMDREQLFRTPDGAVHGYVGQIHGLNAKPGQGMNVFYDEEKSRQTNTVFGYFIGAGDELVAPSTVMRIQRRNDGINCGIH